MFTFDATAGDRFYLDELTDPSSLVSYVIYNQANRSIASISRDEEFTVTTDGTYLLAAKGSGTEALDYSFNLIASKVNTATLNLGETVTGNIGEVGEEDIYTFTADAGQTLYLDGISGGIAAIDVSLTSPSGQTLLNFQNVNSNRNPITLIESGTYQLRVDGGPTVTGDYSFLLSDTNQAPDLNFNSTIADTLEANTSRVFKFFGTKDQNISFEDLGSEYGGYFRLFGPGNQDITARSFRSNFEVTLPGEGIYTLVLDNFSFSSINYNFRVV